MTLKVFGCVAFSVLQLQHCIRSVFIIIEYRPHHPPDYDDFGSQGSTDSEDGHETEAEDHKVDAEDDFTRIEQLSRQPEIEKVGDS